MNALATVAERHDAIVDTFASLALEGMEPTALDIELGRAFINGTKTLDELIAEVLGPSVDR